MQKNSQNNVKTIAACLQSPNSDVRKIGWAEAESIREYNNKLDHQIEAIGKLTETQIYSLTVDIENCIKRVQERFYSLPANGKRAYRCIDYASPTGHSEADVGLIYTFMDNDTASYPAIFSRHVLKVIPHCREVVYKPTKPLLIKHDGYQKANIWIPPKKVERFTAPAQRPELHQEYLDRIIPSSQMCRLGDVEMSQQDYFDDWLARLVFEPNMLCNVAVLLRSIEQGTGKGILFDKAISRLIGASNYQSCLLDDILHRFAGDKKLKVLINIEEVRSHSMDKANHLKQMMTQKTQIVEYKNVQSFNVEVCYAFLLSSNFETPINIELGDRRYFVPDMITHKENKEESADFFGSTWLDWIENGDGLAELHAWFATRQLEPWKFVTAPYTEAKMDITSKETSQALKQEGMVTWLANNEDLCFQLQSLMDKWKCSQNDAAAALKAAGFRHKENGFKINGKRKNVWIHEDNHKVREKVLWAQDGNIYEG